MLNPWLFTGFIDGEGYFSVGISKNKVGWQVKLEFGISLHTKDRVLLEQIQRYFSAGSIFFHPTQKILHYRIRACLFFPFLFTRFTPNPCITAGGLKLKRKGKILKDLEKILDHLDQYPLITQKLADFQLFKQASKLVLNRQHLKLEGLQKNCSN